MVNLRIIVGVVQIRDIPIPIQSDNRSVVLDKSNRNPGTIGNWRDKSDGSGRVINGVIPSR